MKHNGNGLFCWVGFYRICLLAVWKGPAASLFHRAQVYVIIGTDDFIVKGKDTLMVIEQLTNAVLIGLKDGIDSLIIDIELQG